MTKPTLSPIRRLLRGIGAVLAAVWMILEEWVWDRLTAAMKWLGRVPAVRWLETRIARLSPRAAMLVFVVPWLMLLPTQQPPLLMQWKKQLKTQQKKLSLPLKKLQNSL